MTIVDRFGPLRELPDWLVAAADPARVAAALPASLPELAGGRLQVLEVEPGRARLKADRWTIRYRVTLRDDAGHVQTRRLLGTLEPANGSGRGGGVRLGPLGVRVEPEPPDDELPALALLVDPEAARAMLQAAIVAQVPRLGDLRIASCAPRVARYAPGSRCTVVYRLGFAPGTAQPHWPTQVVAKTYWEDKGEVAFAAMRALWATPLARGEPVRVAEPLAYVPEHHLLIQGPVGEEHTLKQLLHDSWRSPAPGARDRLERSVAQAGAGLAALHDCGARPARQARWEDQLVQLRQLLGHLERAIPALGASLEPLLVALARRAGASPPDPLVPAHGSFRPAQVLLCGGEASIIDFDGFCLAEPALDVALFRASARDIALGELGHDLERRGAERALQARADELDGLCDLFLARYQTHRPVSLERVALYETLDLLTVVLHSWTKVERSRLRHGLLLLERHVERLEQNTRT